MVPVSVRTEEQMGTFGNRVSMMIVPIPTDEADPKRRLERTHELLRGAKERHQARARGPAHGRHELHPAGASPRWRRGRRWRSSGRTRPPAEPRDLQRARPAQPAVPRGRASCEANYPVSVVVDGVGLNITVMSYLDHLDFGIVADRDQVDDVWTLMDRLSGALDEITVAVLGKPAKRQGKRATRPLPKAKA